MHDAKITCLGCGVFKMEIEALVRQRKLDCDIITLDSMLHMKPVKLEQEMEQVLDAATRERYLLLYGDCHPHMHEMQERQNTAKISGINCCEILLGKSTYRKLQKEKAFIFLPEWTQRWREVFTYQLGFNTPEMAQTFLKEHCTRLVYIDTGVMPVPGTTLQEISAYFDMPIEVMPISLDTLSQGIHDALQKFIEDDSSDS
ncbi:MAG: DUF1638 domain-containing protein [Desulfuromonadaceae bacterium]|nr:DUF1638 domain-containing protein [Desulfuromonadaceae bacterium]MDD5105549.1 DUF1638 domain-containing protein [Desulfuromonadaceae bacterium]